jgi:hypothetical protein
MALTDTDREPFILDVLTRTLTLIHRSLSRAAGFCDHQPPWPDGPLTAVDDVHAARGAVGAFAAQLAAPSGEDGGCACHRGESAQRHAWAARVWLDISGHALDYAAGRPWITREHLAADENHISRHVQSWPVTGADQLKTTTTHETTGGDP